MEQQQQQEKNKGGLGLFPKLIILIAVAVVGFFFLSGFPTSIGELLFSVLQIAFAILLFYFAYKGFMNLFTPKPFSPTESFNKKLIRVGEQAKPDNVKNLFLRGEDMRAFSKLGKVSGLLFIPYLSNIPLRTPEGFIVYEDKKNKFGEIILDKNKKPIKTPKMEIKTEIDGDWLFIVKKGFFGEKMLVRCHHNLVSPIAENIWIKDINVVPIGDFYYPSKMWATDIHRIQRQQQEETAIETHSHFLDLISNITETTLSADPNYLKLLQLNNEVIANRQSGILGGNQQ